MRTEITFTSRFRLGYLLRAYWPELIATILLVVSSCFTLTLFIYEKQRTFLIPPLSKLIDAIWLRIILSIFSCWPATTAVLVFGSLFAFTLHRKRDLAGIFLFLTAISFGLTSLMLSMGFGITHIGDSASLDNHVYLLTLEGAAWELTYNYHLYQCDSRSVFCKIIYSHWSDILLASPHHDYGLAVNEADGTVSIMHEGQIIHTHHSTQR